MSVTILAPMPPLLSSDTPRWSVRCNVCLTVYATSGNRWRVGGGGAEDARNGATGMRLVVR